MEYQHVKLAHELKKSRKYLLTEIPPQPRTDKPPHVMFMNCLSFHKFALSL